MTSLHSMLSSMDHLRQENTVLKQQVAHQQELLDQQATLLQDLKDRIAQLEQQQQQPAPPPPQQQQDICIPSSPQATHRRRISGEQVDQVQRKLESTNMDPHGLGEDLTTTEAEADDEEEYTKKILGISEIQVSNQKRAEMDRIMSGLTSLGNSTTCVENSHLISSSVKSKPKRRLTLHSSMALSRAASGESPSRMPSRGEPDSPQEKTMDHQAELAALVQQAMAEEEEDDDKRANHHHPSQEISLPPSHAAPNGAANAVRPMNRRAPSVGLVGPRHAPAGMRRPISPSPPQSQDSSHIPPPPLESLTTTTTTTNTGHSSSVELAEAAPISIDLGDFRTPSIALFAAHQNSIQKEPTRTATPLVGTMQAAHAKKAAEQQPVIAILEEDEEDEDEESTDFNDGQAKEADSSSALPTRQVRSPAPYVAASNRRHLKVVSDNKATAFPREQSILNQPPGTPKEEVPSSASSVDNLTIQEDDLTVYENGNALIQTTEVTNRSVRDAYGEKGIYTGSIDRKSVLPDGYGTMNYVGNRSYQGDWALGHWDGHGVLVNSLGDIYDGEFVEDRKQGKGKLQFADGRVFQGKFVSDQMKEGTLWFPDGSRYTGLLDKGQRNGYGLYEFGDGSQYEGQWVDDLMHGRGRMEWSDGGYYNGDWEAGIYHGLGMEVNPDGTIRHQGKWEQGKPLHETDE